eukprot:jgi/Ulvmu1/3908/UM018_0130.1
MRLQWTDTWNNLLSRHGKPAKRPEVLSHDNQKGLSRSRAPTSEPHEAASGDVRDKGGIVRQVAAAMSAQAAPCHNEHTNIQSDVVSTSIGRQQSGAWFTDGTWRAHRTSSMCAS